MKFLDSDDVIIACSTGMTSNAALAVIRISGFKDLSIFSGFFSQKSAPIEPRKVYYLSLLENGTQIDDICLTYFKGPHSYNGENILELSIHGNLLHVERVLNLFTKNGLCRLASPGEFTYRALKNKKLNLSQVEGLDLFLNADSVYALGQGLSLLNGDLQESYHKLHELFLRHKSALELSIDFLDDVGEETAQGYFKESLLKLSQAVESLAKRVLPQSQSLIEPDIVLVGLPNSGKSSLFNFLLSNDRAIVSSIAGTTRDYLAEKIQLEGVNYRLIDTAGVRETKDVIESQGVARSLSRVKNAFFRILLINPFESDDESFADLLKYEYDLIFFTHADLDGFEEKRSQFTERFCQVASGQKLNILSLDDKFLSNLLKVHVNKKYLDITSASPILLDRHKSLILQLQSAIQSYQELAQNESDIAIIGSELNTLGHCISELIGIISPDQVLDSIFSNFCIGK